MEFAGGAEDAERGDALVFAPLVELEAPKEGQRVAQALDPLRLLEQHEQLQKALWRHAVKPGTSLESDGPGAPLPFSV